MLKKLKIFPTDHHRNFISKAGQHIKAFCSFEKQEKIKTATQFVTVEEKNFPDFNINRMHFCHSKFETNYIHFEAKDPLRAFAVLLKFPQLDAKGYPVILERMLQCGSKSFPLRDIMSIALSEIEKRGFDSLTTNSYLLMPIAASSNQTLFVLRDLLLECLFHPRLEHGDFLDQAFRLEFQGSNLRRSGAAYERLMNDYGLQSFYFLELLNRKLFKNTAFANSACGTPNGLATTSFEEFLAYYEEQVCPENIAFMTYGDVDYTETLSYLENQLFKRFVKEVQPRPSNFKKQNELFSETVAAISNLQGSSLPQPNKSDGSGIKKPFDLKPLLDQSGFLKTKLQIEDGPLPDYYAKPNKGAQISLSFLCVDAAKNSLDYFGLQLLSLLLFEGFGAPFYQNFISTGKATGLCSGHGFDGQSIVPVFTLGLKGVDNDQQSLEKLSTEIKTLLVSLAKDGFDRQSVNRFLELIEINVKTQTSEYGINFLHEAAPFIANSRLEIFDSQMNFARTLQMLKLKLQRGNFLQNLLIKYFLTNPATIELALKPSAEHYSNLLLEQKRAGSDAFIALNTNSRTLLEQQSFMLSEARKALQDFSVVPYVSPSQVDKEFSFTTKSETKVDGVPLLFVGQPTKKVIFLRFRVDITDFTVKEKEHIYIIEKVLGKVSNSLLSQADFDAAMQNIFGGFECRSECFKQEETTFSNFLAVEAFFLDDKLERAFNMISQILINPGFENLPSLSERIKFDGLAAAEHMVGRALSSALQVAEETFNSALNKDSEFRKVS